MGSAAGSPRAGFDAWIMVVSVLLCYALLIIHCTSLVLNVMAGLSQRVMASHNSLFLMREVQCVMYVKFVHDFIKCWCIED